ncbi:MAG: aspartyl protease family protein [Litorimonas sp.]
MRSAYSKSIAGVFGLMAADAALAQPSTLADAVSQPIRVERPEPVSTVPLTLKYGKLQVDAKLSETAGRFVFDTGSPTILTRDYADRIGVRYIGRNTGRDSNGTEVVMDIAIADSIDMGGTVFRDVPVMVSAFENSPMARCVLHDGVIGSEILEGSAWKIDLEAELMTIGPDAKSVGTARRARTAPLHSKAYPHMPIVDYTIGDIQDRALFDTGNSAVLALYSRVLASDSVDGSIEEDSVQRGRGSEGVSAGGLGKETDLARFDVDKMRIGENTMRGLPAISRANPPSLIGAGFLSDFIVTLDYVADQFRFEERTQSGSRPDRPDFALSVVDGQAVVSQLFQRTRAAKAGLRIGDVVTSVNGKSVKQEPQAGDCSLLDWILTDFDANSTRTLVVVRQGERIALELFPK